MNYELHTENIYVMKTNYKVYLLKHKYKFRYFFLHMENNIFQEVE